MVLYMAIVVYAPALAIAQGTDVQLQKLVDILTNQLFIKNN